MLKLSFLLSPLIFLAALRLCLLYLNEVTLFRSCCRSFGVLDLYEFYIFKNWLLVHFIVWTNNTFWIHLTVCTAFIVGLLKGIFKCFVLMPFNLFITGRVFSPIAKTCHVGEHCDKHLDIGELGGLASSCARSEEMKYFFPVCL